MGNSATCAEVTRGCDMCQGQGAERHISPATALSQSANASTHVLAPRTDDGRPAPQDDLEGLEDETQGCNAPFVARPRIPPRVLGSVGVIKQDSCVAVREVTLAVEEEEPVVASGSEPPDVQAAGSRRAASENPAKSSCGMKEALGQNGHSATGEMPEGWLGSAKAAQRIDPCVSTVANRGSTTEPVARIVDLAREQKKAICGTSFVVIFWALVVCIALWLRSDYEEPSCTDETETEVELCEECGTGTILLPAFGNYELSLNKYVRAPFYFIGLLWAFLGIGIVCDQFMGAIEVITSAKKDVWMDVRSGTKHKFRVKVWNTTLANLTLMALGSSAPEILLSVIEVMGAEYFAGDLGPSTIVGSAAFNLLVITAVCVSSIPPGEKRSIACTDVFAVTASCSILAYVWLLIMLQYSSPDLVETWEAMVTFAAFPVLCVIAFAADKGWLAPICRCGRKRGGALKNLDMEAEMQKLQNKYGKELPESTINTLLWLEAEKTQPQAAARAAIRKNIMANAAGKAQQAVVSHGDNGADLAYGFANSEHIVLENAGALQVRLVASRPSACTVQMSYCTVDGTAQAGVRYQHVEGVVKFLPNQVERVIEVQILDDNVWQPDEYFTVVLRDLQVLSGRTRPSDRPPTQSWSVTTSYASTGETMEPRLGIDTTIVTVLNDDTPGTIDFDADETYAREGSVVQIGVVRSHGCCGRVQVHYATAGGSAVHGKDFKHTEGSLVFEDGEVHRTIDVQTMASGSIREGNDRFQIVLSDASPGLKFNENTDGGSTGAICDVIILPTGDQPSFVTHSLTRWLNKDHMVESLSTWLQHLVSAFYCGGSPEEQESASCRDWLFHLVSLTWKVVFAMVPPPSMWGGWACFCGALGCIGLVTALVGDMANLLGCCLKIPNEITAITLVALGTSLPDTFASMVAAQQDDTADNSVGNVTGSNSVNVFLGLGLPWTVAAFYWEHEGRTVDWDNRRYRDTTYKDKWGDKYPGGGFLMPAGSLAQSVAVFTACALACVALLVFRRFRYGGELGGPWLAQRRDSMILSGLWLLYVGLSIYTSLSRT